MTSWNPRGKANTKPAPCAGQPLHQDRLSSLWLTSVLSVCPADFYWESFQAQVCYAPQLTAEGSGPLLLFQSWWWQMVHNILTTLPHEAPHEPWAKGHLVTLCLQPWMARACPLAHAAPAGAGLRAGHQTVSLKHGNNSLQVARLLSQHSSAKRIESFLTTARKWPEFPIYFLIFFFKSRTEQCWCQSQCHRYNLLGCMPFHAQLLKTQRFATVGRLYIGRQTCMPRCRCLGCSSTGSLVEISLCESAGRIGPKFPKLQHPLHHLLPAKPDFTELPPKSQGWHLC